HVAADNAPNRGDQTAQDAANERKGVRGAGPISPNSAPETSYPPGADWQTKHYRDETRYGGTKDRKNIFAQKLDPFERGFAPSARRFRDKKQSKGASQHGNGNTPERCFLRIMCH